MTQEPIANLRQIFPTPVSPESQDLSPSDLANLSKAVGRVSRFLTFAAQDLARARDRHANPVYLLDFSELYSYLWPEASKSPYREVIKYLLFKSKLKFVLPLAAMMELFNKLRLELSSQTTRQDELQELMSNPFYSTLIQFYQTQSGADEPTAFSSEVVENLVKLLRELRGEDERNDLLASLYDSERVRLILQVFDPKDLRPNITILEEAYSRLSANRPFRDDIVNYVDAHNYATAFTLTEKLYPNTRQICYLVTSSPVPYKTFDTIKWEEDPDFGIAPDFIFRTSLVRHPIQLLLQSYFEQSTENPEEELREVRSDLNVLHNEWSKIKDEKSFSVFGHGLKLENTERQIYLSALDRYIAFYRKVLRPVAELVSADQAREANRRTRLGVDAVVPSGVIVSTVAEERQADVLSADIPNAAEISYRDLIVLFDKVITQTHHEVDRLSKTLRKTPRELLADLDISGAIVAPDKVSIDVVKDKDTNSIEFTAFVSSHSTQPIILLCADRYEDYTSFWWRTGVTFPEFIRAARYFVKSAKSQLRATKIVVDSSKQRQFLGYYIYTDQGTYHYALEQLPEELNAGDLLELAGREKKIRFVRLGLVVGDLCYDFEPFGMIPQRAGIVTHLPLSDPIANFVEATVSTYAQRSTIKEAITRILTPTSQK